MLSNGFLLGSQYQSPVRTRQSAKHIVGICDLDCFSNMLPESQEWHIARRTSRDDASLDDDLGGRGSGKICHRSNHGIFALSADYGAQLERHDGLCWRVVIASSGIGAGMALGCDFALEKVQARP